ncbi:MAG: ABC transporter ATP-binding protein [Candidatus Aminicenantes bacterium]|nr:ABC transporter ATP-binding protein [Candidatus Aminicenantes bacterium]
MIRLRGVWFSYNGSSDSVLSDVNLEIPPGTVAALVGPNGSGKTTLLHLLLGWLKPKAGEILVADRSIGLLAGRERSRLVGHVAPEETAVLDLDIREYVSIGRTPHIGWLGKAGADDDRAVREALSVVDLLHKAAKPVRTLSTGERQLASIARALAQDPEILLLDEPTSHLDLVNTRRILRVMCVLRERGKTIVLTTHDPNTASVLADTIILLRQGRVAATGSPDEVITGERLGAVYGIEIDVRTIDGRPHVLARV